MHSLHFTKYIIDYNTNQYSSAQHNENQFSFNTIITTLSHITVI